MPRARLPYHDATADEALATIKSTGGVLHQLTASNVDAADYFIQLFDAASGCDVTLGTTVPVYVVFVPAGDASLRGAVDVPLCLDFQKGITLAVTTTAGGCTGPTTELPLSASYS